jgi:hypothetical protein
MATLLEIRTMAYQRANMEVDTGIEDEDRFVTDTETDRLINLGYKELYGYLVRQGMHRAESTQTITADGSSGYALNSNFFALLTVHRVDSDGVAYLLGRHDHRQRPRTDLGGAPANTYRIVGSTIVFSPVPDDGTYEVRYVPVPATLSAAADELDGVLGWEEYVVLYTAAKLLQKEGSFNAAAALQQDARILLERIKDEAQAAELSEGTVVQNVRGGEPYTPGDFTTGGRPGLWWYFW